MVKVGPRVGGLFVRSFIRSFVRPFVRSFVRSFTTTTTSAADADWRRRHTASANDVGDRRSRGSNPYIGDPYALSAVNLDDDGHMGDTYSNPSPANPVLKTGVKGKRGMPSAGR